MKIWIQEIKEELKNEIMKEFLEVIRNVPLNESGNMLLLGEKYAFHYIGVTRTKYTVQFRFKVYRKTDVIKYGIEKYRIPSVGMIYIITYLPRKRKRNEEEYYS